MVIEHLETADCAVDLHLAVAAQSRVGKAVAIKRVGIRIMPMRKPPSERKAASGCGTWRGSYVGS